MTTKTFVPRIVGKPDLKKRTEIEYLAQDVIVTASALFTGLKEVFPKANISTEDVLELIRTNDPEKRLKEFYVKDQNVALPGIKTEKLIESDLLDIPEEEFDFAFILIDEIKTALGSPLLSYFNPLPYIYLNKEEDLSLRQEYFDRVNGYTEEVTQNELQNEILEELEKIETSLNVLIEKGVLSTRTGLRGVFADMFRVFSFNRQSGIVEISSGAFVNGGLKRTGFDNKKRFERRINIINNQSV